MSAFSTKSANDVYELDLRGGPRWIALFYNLNGLETNAPSGEVTGNGYVRLAINGATGRAFTAPNAGSGSNAQVWEFAAATGNWASPVTHWALMSAATAGDVIRWAECDDEIQINTGMVYRIPPNTLIFNHL